MPPKAMRRLVLLLVLVTCATPPPPPPAEKRDLRDELRRHGEWILVSPYGKLWHPHATEVGKDFVPYVSGGRWTRTGNGLAFEGRWEWSDVVFHHGRWLWTQDFDWLWWHDENDGPAFVDWRTGSEYVAWSPLPPPPPRAGLAPPERRWFTVKARHFMQDDIAKYLVPEGEGVRAAELSEPAPNGPTVDFLVKTSGLVDEGDGGDRAPELAGPAPAPEPTAVEAPKSNVEVDVVKQPDQPRKAKPKKGKKK